MFYPRRKYELVNNVNGEIYELVNDPKGWDESERKIKRSAKNFSLVREFSKNLEFVKKDAAKLALFYGAYDIEAGIQLIEYKLTPNSTTEEYYIHSKGELDFSNYSRKDNIVKVPFSTGGLDKELTAQISEKFDLKRTESITGVDIGELEVILTELVSRQILLISQLKQNNTEPLSVQLNALQGRAVIFNLDIVSNSNIANVQGVYGDQQWTYSNTEIEQPRFFYYNSDVAKTVKVRVAYDIIASAAGMGTTKHLLRVYRFNRNATTGAFSWQQGYDIANLDYQDAALPIVGVTEREIEINENDCLFLYYEPEGGSGTVSEFYTVAPREIEITITEDSITPTTYADGVFLHDAINRVCQIITGRDNVLYSESLGRTALGYSQDGEFALNAITLGFWIRNFLDKGIELSLKSALASVDAMHSMTYSIYNIGNVERLIIEPLEFFFQADTVIDLGEIADLEESVASEFYYRGLEVGYKKPEGDRLYEEAMGLDEHNVKNTWTLPITRSENTYTKVSDIRNDGYGKAFASRKPKINYPEEDTQYDKSIFHLDLKEGLGAAYIEKTWQDYYTVAPEGIYSPDTATGLNFTPLRMMERHESFFSACLSKEVFQGKYIRFASSTGNSSLVTQKSGEIARAENGDKIISDTKITNMYPKWYKFKSKVDYNISLLLDGTTEVNGREIPNVFFKVKFRYKNETLYGYIFEVKPNKEGDWKLLKAY